MKKRIIFLIIPLLLLTGCAIRLKTGSVSDSGFFVSLDDGKKWEQKVEIYTVGEGRSFFKSAQANFLKIDPQDTDTFYLGTMENGLMHTHNKGLAWSRTLTGKGAVNDLAVDPRNKCILYGAVGNKIYKSIDCARTWESIYLDGLSDQSINSIAIDSYNNNKVYFGTSGGGVFKSTDYGMSWESIKWFKSSVKKIIINSKNTAKVYIATNTKGIFKSDNEGISWYSITDKIKGDTKKNKSKYKNVDYYRDLEFDNMKEDAIIYANKYGLFYSRNGGGDWNEIKLLSKPNTVNIYSVAINPQDSRDIYYTTATALYKSFNAGGDWTTESLPTSKVPVDILVDAKNSKTLYMAVKKIKK